MKMIEILEKDKERLLTEMSGTPSPEKAVKVLENELDAMLLKFNEQCSSDRARDTAAYLLQVIRLSLPLMDSVGRTKVWESGEDPNAPRKFSLSVVLLTIAGLALTVFGVAPLAMYTFAAGNTSAIHNEVIMRSLFAVFGLIIMFISGTLYSKPNTGKVTRKKRKEQQVEIHVDPDKVYRSFRNAILSADQSLEEIEAQERWDKRDQAGSIDGRKLSPAEIDLFSDLLAAAYSNDPEYAVEKIEEIKYFLHRQQIEVVDYSADNAKYFDLMPGTQKGTIRPALIADGIVLRKGMASAKH